QHVRAPRYQRSGGPKGPGIRAPLSLLTTLRTSIPMPYRSDGRRALRSCGSAAQHPSKEKRDHKVFVNPDPTYRDQANRVQTLHAAICDVRDTLGKAAPDA